MWLFFHRLSNLYVCHHKMGSPKETPLIDVEIIDVAASEMSGAEYILTVSNLVLKGVLHP